MDIDAKLRPLYLLKILKEQTDENHQLSTVQLCQILKDDYDIDTFRTTIKTDIEILQQAGYTIRVTRSSQNMYHYQKRDYDTHEIKTLLDAVSSSEMISNDERNQLMNKLYKLAGPFKAHELKRNWISSDNSFAGLAQIVDVINEAISKRRKIRFRAFGYNVKKKAVPDRDEQVLSPWFFFKDGKYVFVIGCADGSQNPTKQRVDHIYNTPEIIDELAATPANSRVDMVAAVPFGVYGSEIREVEMQVDNALMNEIIEKFGLSVTTYACDQNSFRVITSVGVNQEFYNWLFSFQGRIRLKSPDSVCQEYAKMVRTVAETVGII